MTYKVFICYRRDDKEFARSIERRLLEEWDPDEVFLDLEDVGPGREWKKRVTKALKDDPVVVTLITGTWNSIRAGQRRLLDDADHMRFELEAALERKLPVIPVLYEPARWPKEEQLPPTLHSLLRFQRVPFSQERWDYDAGELVRAVKGVLGEPAEAPKAAEAPQAEPPADSPRTVRPYQPSGRVQLPTTISRSLFQESPEERKARQAALQETLEKEEARRERARAEAIPFFARPDFWFAAFLTLVLGAAALVGGEALARVIANNWTSLPDPSIPAAILVVTLYALARIGLGAAAYWYDPEQGGRVFYTRGLFGGYVLGFSDYEPVGFWAAFPFASAGSWAVARIAAWFPYNYWEWSYGLIFWLVLSLYTLFVLGFYIFLTLEEAVDL